MELADSLAFAAGILGVFIAAPLFHLRKQRFANVFLGCFILGFSFLSFASTSFYYERFYLFGSLDWCLAILGPSFYLYVRTICGDTLSRKALLHLLPLTFLIIYLIIFRLVPASRPFFGIFLLIIQGLTFGYAVASLLRLKTYKRELLDNFSSTKGRDLRWLTWLSFTMIALLIVWVPATIHLGGGFWGALLLTGRVMVLYFVGWYGLKQNVVLIPTPSAFEPPKDEPTKYQRSGMNEESKTKIQGQLNQCMVDEELYLKNDLKLLDLATKMETSTQLLSEYFNQVLSKSFFQYVNELRVEKAKQLLSTQDQVPIIEVAYAAGFNSKSTFNASFKKIAGISPSNWRDQQVFQT